MSGAVVLPFRQSKGRFGLDGAQFAAVLRRVVELAELERGTSAFMGHLLALAARTLDTGMAGRCPDCDALALPNRLLLDLAPVELERAHVVTKSDHPTIGGRLALVWLEGRSKSLACLSAETAQ